MLDIHSHILPKMDDGSKSTEMSLEMLRRSKAQGVDTIISTSHFYADHESPDHFLARRAASRERLESRLTGSEPRILYGAEVFYYPGISHSEEIAQLAVRGTSLIMIEMPFIPWQENVFDELLSFQYMNRLSIVLAHVERYQDLQKKNVYQKLFDLPVYFQCNAEAFTRRRSRKLALELLDSGLLHFLGTDCHNITDRPPNMQEAQKVIEKKFSPRMWSRLAEDSMSLLDRLSLPK